MSFRLVSASGHVHSFVLTEGTATDLKFYVAADDSMRVARGSLKRFYTATEVDALRRL
jgi:hypothetical protein